MAQERTRSRRGRGGLRWLIGLAVLGAVVVMALRFADAREFLAIAERARPSWLALACALQAGTYLAQGEVVRSVASAGGARLRLATVYRLSLLKLFVDQALPSAGLSGSAVLADELREAGVPRQLIAAAVVISIASYQVAYVGALALALPLLAMPRDLRLPVFTVLGLFMVSALVWSATILALSGRDRPRLTRLLNLRPLRALLSFLRDADTHVARSPRQLGQASAWQLAIFFLDAATLWVLIRSLGAQTPPSAAYVSFLISSVLRSIGLVPGGVGTFEAMSVFSLKLAGVPVGVALAATLLFRGLSFWIPMLPGLWLYRARYVRRHELPADESAVT